jgi:hypothetical protein
MQIERIPIAEFHPHPEIEPCPKCGSITVDRMHHVGSFAAPECDYNLCFVCGYQWGHE